jgi:hypothetical protein
MRKELLVEAVVVGISTTIAGKLLEQTGMSTSRPLFWFTLGALTHIGWEAVGGNRWYVETRKASDLPKGFL